MTTPAGKQSRTPRAPRAPVPSASDIEQLADWIAAARAPLVITGLLGQDPRDAVVLSRLAERWALPVIPYNTRYFAISANHPMFQGSMPGPLLRRGRSGDRDRIRRAVDAEQGSAAGRRAHRADRRGSALRALSDARLSIRPDDHRHARCRCWKRWSRRCRAAPARIVEQRRARLVARSAELHAQWRAEAEQAGRGDKNTLAWLNHCLREVVDRDTIVINEYSFRQEYCPLETPGSLFGVSAAGGLGWGFGASLGAKLAAPQRQVLSVLGDGAYMFANPTACHYMAQMQNLPVLTVIYNNALYGAVRRATLDMYGNGVAAQGDGRLLADLPAPNFEKIVAAHDGHGERVERPADLPAALRRAADGGARRPAGAGERDLPALMPRSLATRVLIVGGGPVGTTLAMDLAWRGIDVVVAELRHRGEPPSVKCNHVAARTMEIFRRLGVAQRVRDAGLPHDYPNDVAFRTTTTGIELARIPIPCRRDRFTVKDGPDGWWPTPEPPHRINQIYLEPVLVAHAAAMPACAI